MKNKLLFSIGTAALLLCAGSLSAQAPNLGSAAGFVLFTSNGALTNTGLSHLTGHVGSNSGSSTGFGNVNGVMNNNNGASALCSGDLLTAYGQLNATIATFFPAPLLGNGQTLNAGIYSISGNSTMNLILNLDAQTNANAVFIIKIQGSFSANAASQVVLLNGAKACNVFWKVEGLVSLAAGTKMKGTIVANNAAINISSGAELEGRALSTTGAITINNILAYTPIGCGSPVLTGPAAPNLASTVCYALFSGNGALTNTGNTYATGDVGTNVGLTTGFNPLNITGTIHPIPDGSTGACAADLLNVYTYLNTLPMDIELLYPVQFGNSLVLTPHTYSLNGGTILTDTLFLDGGNNPNGVFVIAINGALSTSTYAQVVLTNGTQSKNVFWKIDGAVNINNFSKFKGTIVCNNGAVSLNKGMKLDGRAFTTNGAFATDSINVTMPVGCNTGTTTAPTIVTQPVDKTVCKDSSAVFSVVATGSGLTYQWRKGSTNLVNGGSVTGATSASLKISPVAIADASALYNVIVSGSAAPSSTSSSVSLVVNNCSTVGIEVFSAVNGNKTASLFPNPFSNSITLKMVDVSQVNNSELRIYNVIGVQVLVMRIKDKSTTLEANFPAGVYFYDISNETGILQSGRIISTK
ncbi:MAG: ice-binding family protein [bacterium]|nr:ice-binding family protein [bacterium]